MTAMATAGGAVAPITSIVSDSSSAYVGLGYGFGTSEAVASSELLDVVASIDTDNVALQAGYNFNEYIAVEGRYNIGLDEDVMGVYGVNTVSVDTFALFAKPQYPITSELSVYGLVGYAWSDLNANDETDSVDGFAWGLGAKYLVVENVEVFIDYTSVYDDAYTDEDVNIDTDIYNVTVGASYKF